MEETFWSWPGLVGELDGEVSAAAGLEKAAVDDPGEDGHVNIAAGHQAHHLFAFDVHLIEHGGGHRHRAGPFRDELLLLDKGQNGGRKSRHQ